MLLKTSAIYHISYSNWKTNPTKIYIFVLYAGVNKVHCLNIGARQLSTVNRLKLIHLIKRLSKLPQATRYNGRVLYRIFRTYAPNAIRQCYRTYWRQFITRYALVNYGLNQKEEFTEIELKYQHPDMYKIAKRDLIISTLDAYTRKGASQHVRDKFAAPEHDEEE